MHFLVSICFRRVLLDMAMTYGAGLRTAPLWCCWTINLRLLEHIIDHIFWISGISHLSLVRHLASLILTIARVFKTYSVVSLWRVVASSVINDISRFTSIKVGLLVLCLSFVVLFSTDLLCASSWFSLIMPIPAILIESLEMTLLCILLMS